MPLRQRNSMCYMHKSDGMAHEISGSVRAWCEKNPMLMRTTSSKDGLRHRYHRDAWFAMLCAVLSLAAPSFDSEWTDSLPPPTSPTLHCIAVMLQVDKRTYTLVAEAHEKLGLRAQGIEWAQVGIACTLAHHDRI